MTAVGRFFAAATSVVGIGIIEIPTGIIAAFFFKVIGKKGPARGKICTALIAAIGWKTGTRGRRRNEHRSYFYREVTML